MRHQGVAPARAARQSGLSDQRPRLCQADYEIVKVAVHLESTRLFDPADLHWLEAGRSNQPLDFLSSAIVVGHVEKDCRLR